MVTCTWYVPLASVVRNVRASLAEGVSGKVFNVGCGESLSLIDLLREICKRLGVEYAPKFADARQGDVKHSWADISAAQQELGYEVKVGWREGLKPTIDYYAELARETVNCTAG